MRLLTLAQSSIWAQGGMLTKAHINHDDLGIPAVKTARNISSSLHVCRFGNRAPAVLTPPSLTQSGAQLMRCSSQEWLGNPRLSDVFEESRLALQDSS